MVTAGDFVFADLQFIRIVFSFEDGTDDRGIDHSFSWLSEDDVFWTDHDIDFLIGWEVIDAWPDFIEEADFSLPCHRPGEDVGFSDEVGHIGGSWLVIDLFRGSDLLDIAIFHDDDFIRHRKGLFLVVSDIDKGDA